MRTTSKKNIQEMYREPRSHLYFETKFLKWLMTYLGARHKAAKVSRLKNTIIATKVEEELRGQKQDFYTEDQ